MSLSSTASRRSTVESASYDEGLRGFMLSVFNRMTIGLGVTGLVAYLISASPALTQFFLTGVMSWVSLLSPFAFLLVLMFGINRLSYAAAQGVFWAYCGVMGISMTAIVLTYTGASVALAFAVTAGTFAAMSLYGYTTKTDLTKMGSFLMMALFGLLIAMIANLFFASSVMDVVISVAAVLIFTGLTAYDVQSLKDMYLNSNGREDLAKMGILGSLNLYLDFLNLFLHILRLTGTVSKD